MSRLRGYLPGFVANLNGVGQLLDALGLETDGADAAARLACRQLAASTAGPGLGLWERELGLPPRPDLPESDRRALVLAGLSFFGPCTPQGVSGLLARMTGGQVSYDERPAEYAVYLHTHTPGRVVPDLPGVARAVGKTLPAHVAGHVSAEGDLAAAERMRLALHGYIELHLYAG